MDTQEKSLRPALKICGLRSVADTLHCLRAGVDYVGFNFAPGSKRYMDPGAAAAVWREAHAMLSQEGQVGAARTRAVGVFVNPTDGELTAVLAAFPELQVIQLHGEESPAMLAAARGQVGVRPLWKAIPVAGPRDLERVAAYQNFAELVLFDAAPVLRNGAPSGLKAASGLGVADRGGTGRRFDWRDLSQYQGPLAFGVAGGIAPGSLEELRAWLPSGSTARTYLALIDVASGVETAPGVKSAAAITALSREMAVFATETRYEQR